MPLSDESTYALLDELASRGVDFVAKIKGFDATCYPPPGGPDGVVGFSGKHGPRLFEYFQLQRGKNKEAEDAPATPQRTELERAIAERDHLAAQLGIATSQTERYLRPLLSFIETVESTGGVKDNLDPVEAPAWHDLGEAYVEACSAIEHPAKYAKDTDARPA